MQGSLLLHLHSKEGHALRRGLLCLLRDSLVQASPPTHALRQCMSETAASEAKRLPCFRFASLRGTKQIADSTKSIQMTSIPPLQASIN